jgi:NAD(P)H-nitrite reductase large subunit
VSSAKLESGETMECDLVVAGIGVLPVAERLANSGIQMDNAEAPNFAAATAKSPAKAA